MKPLLNDLMERIFSLSKHGIKMGLSNMKTSMDRLELDISDIRFIHIAGTNGKGSTAATLNSLIMKHSDGQKTGLYTSPHLVRFNERIAVDGKLISDEEMVKIADLLFTECADIPLTFFEFTTLMALCHFKNNRVKFAIMETGLGGRLDATNIIEPEVTIITSIGYDHMEYLGNTLDQIALEKAGIFKECSSAVIADTCCNKVLKQQAAQVGIKRIYELGNNFNYMINNDNSFDLTIDEDRIYASLKKKLLGKHQYTNSALALTAFWLLGLKGTSSSITEALMDVKWPGRLEQISSNSKKVYLDVSHNVEGIQKTIEFLNTEHKNEAIYVACGFMKDKDYEKMIGMLSKISKKLFLIPTNVNGRELGPQEYKTTILKGQKDNILICNDFNDAIDKMRQEDGVLLFTGSIYNYEHLYKKLQEGL